MVVLCFRLISRMRFITSMEEFVSRLAVASSRIKISGLLASARAMVTLCCSPPDNSDGKCPIRSSRPTLLRRSLARCLRFFLLSFPCRVIGSSTFSNALIVAIKLKV
mmetsp:Transcript_5453/g.20384  ORF Transcript_5453/g.20384 Transcript_5453/m.20384 type:complete len:107 (+) Transcript_5453:332-652(+)